MQWLALGIQFPETFLELFFEGSLISTVWIRSGFPLKKCTRKQFGNWCTGRSRLREQVTWLESEITDPACTWSFEVFLAFRWAKITRGNQVRTVQIRIFIRCLRRPPGGRLRPCQASHRIPHGCENGHGYWRKPSRSKTKGKLAMVLRFPAPSGFKKKHLSLQTEMLRIARRKTKIKLKGPKLKEN